MNAENAVIILILLGIVGGIVFYLLRARKRGERCIGCPYAKQCGGKCTTAQNGESPARAENLPSNGESK